MTTKKSIYSALSDFQQKVKIIPFDSKGYNYKYASLTAVWNAIQTPLLNAGLVVTQIMKEPPQGFDVCVHTILTHPETGDQVESILPMTSPKKDPQGFGSSITYARRYSLVALLGLVADEDIDASDNKLENHQVGSPVPVNQIDKNKHKAEKEKLKNDIKELMNLVGIDTNDLNLLMAEMGINARLTGASSIDTMQVAYEYLMSLNERKSNGTLEDKEQAVFAA